MTVKPVLNQYNIYIAQHIKRETLTWGIKPHFRTGQRSPLLCVWKQLFTGPYNITIVCTLFQWGRQKQDRHLFWGILNIQFGSILLRYPERHKPPLTFSKVVLYPRMACPADTKQTTHCLLCGEFFTPAIQSSELWRQFVPETCHGHLHFLN